MLAVNFRLAAGGRRWRNKSLLFILRGEITRSL